MTLEQLLGALEELLDADPGRRFMPVTFGESATPVEGGVVRGDYINLAPVPLSHVGGF